MQNDTLICEDFNKFYAFLNRDIRNNGKLIHSRNGDTKEVMDFKTTLTNPRKRCIGILHRDINIYFLLAEAMWIFVGRRDVKFLSFFNSRMENYSDNGKYFHAPYGWRLRKYGVDSMAEYDEENMHAMQGFDQIKNALFRLEKNPEDRRIVLAIWNPEFDATTEGKDLPCNDLLMFKVREGKLCITIENRSNDLHWGFTTNIFQFSFLLEIMSLCLGIDVGTQTHNAQSLHIYENSKEAENMERQAQEISEDYESLYNLFQPSRIDFDSIAHENDNAEKRLNIFTNSMNDILRRVEEFEKTNADSFSTGIQRKLFENNFGCCSVYLQMVEKLLYIYVAYGKTKRSTPAKIQSIELLDKMCCFYFNVLADKIMEDVLALAYNFFLAKLTEEERKDVIKDINFFTVEQREKLGTF